MTPDHELIYIITCLERKIHFGYSEAIKYLCEKEKMRLSKFEADTIKKVAREIWGNEVIVCLFGSRTDDRKKGGDIDLYIQLPVGQDSKTLMLQKARFLGKLDFLLGEQKIDVLIKTTENQRLSIVNTAESTGIVI